MNKTIQAAFVATLGLAAVANVACSRKHEGAKPAGVAAAKPQVDPTVAQANEQEMKTVFTQIDKNYDYSNTTLAEKFEDVKLTQISLSNQDQRLGTVKGEIKIKGFDHPVSFYSGAAAIADLRSEKGVSVVTNGNPKMWEALVGGQAVGQVKCLDDNCQRVAVYLSIGQGAGYIFNADETGYAIVNQAPASK